MKTYTHTFDQERFYEMKKESLIHQVNMRYYHRTKIKPVEKTVLNAFFFFFYQNAVIEH